MAVQYVPYDDSTPLDPASNSVGSAQAAPRLSVLPVPDDIVLDKPATPQMPAPAAVTPPAPFSRPMPNPWDSISAGAKAFFNAGPAPLIDPMVSGALGTDASASDKSNHYVKAPADAQAIFGETMQVPDERSMVPLRDPETGKLAVYYRTPEAEQGRLTSVASAVAPFLATSGPPAAAALASRAVEPVVNAAAGVFNRVGIGTGETRGVAAIRRAIEEGAAGGGPDALDMTGQLINNNGKQPLTLADVGSTEVKELLGQALRVPGPHRTAGTNFFVNRDAGAGARLGGDINDALGGERTAFQTTGDLTTAQKKAAQPAYDKAMANDAYSPRVQEFLNEPVVKQGLNQGIKLERLDALAEGRPFDPLSYGVDLDAQGNWVTKGTPNMRVLDAGKRGLDAMIAAERNDLTGKLSPLGRSLAKVKDSYVGELDRLNPDYAAARASFSGPAGSMDALRQGATFMTMSPEEIAQAVKGLAPGDQAFFKIGAEQALRRAVAQTGRAGDESRAALRSNDRIAQIRSVFGGDQEGFDRLMSAAKKEEMMKGTLGNTLGNSRTQARAVQDAHGGGSLVTPAVEAIAAFGAHEPMVGVKSAGGFAKNLLGRLTGMTPQVADRIQSILLDPTLSGDPARLYRALLPQQRSLQLSLAPGPALIPQGLLGGPAVPQGLLAPPSASR